MTTINAKIRSQANKIIAKYNGYRKPQEIAKMYAELSEMGVTIPMFAGNMTALNTTARRLKIQDLFIRLTKCPKATM